MSAKLPFITIAVPTYKRVNFLKQALGSALSQDYPFFEVIVHDDAPDDGVRTIVEGFASDKVRYRQNRPPLGLVPKLNDFLRLAKGEWMIVLCDDDVLEPGYLAAIGDLAAAHPQASLIRTRSRVIDQEGKVIREDAPCPARMSAYEFASRVLDIQNKLFTMNITGIAFRPKTLETLGGFTPFHRGAHTDCLAWLTLGSTGASFCDERPLCCIRQYGGSVTMTRDPDFEATFETNLRMRREVLAIINRLESDAKTNDERKLAKECRRTFKCYFSRMPAAYDTAFEHVLLNRSLPFKEFRRVFGVMRELNVPFHRRFLLYCLLALVPIPLRKKAIDSFSLYREKKTQEYHARVGFGV